MKIIIKGDPSLIECTTLKDALFMGMKNDTSFLIADTHSVYEHHQHIARICH